MGFRISGSGLLEWVQGLRFRVLEIGLVFRDFYEGLKGQVTILGGSGALEKGKLLTGVTGAITWHIGLATVADLLNTPDPPSKPKPQTPNPQP